MEPHPAGNGRVREPGPTRNRHCRFCGDEAQHPLVTARGVFCSVECWTGHKVVIARLRALAGLR